MTQKIMFVFKTSPEALASGIVHLVDTESYNIRTHCLMIWMLIAECRRLSNLMGWSSLPLYC